MLFKSYSRDILQVINQVRTMPCTYRVKKSSHDWTKGISGSSSCLRHTLENNVEITFFLFCLKAALTCKSTRLK